MAWRRMLLVVVFLVVSLSQGAGALEPEAQVEAVMEKKGALTDAEGAALLLVARGTIEERLFGKRTIGQQPLEAPVFQERKGTFVTLTTKGKLRGCIGHILPEEPLVEGIKANALNAAFRDPRFPPLGKEEWQDLKVEISVLTVPRPLPYKDAQELLASLRPRVDGVIIRKGFYQATFLPQVWEQLPGKEDFLGHLCMKAGLDALAWKKGDLEVSTYQVQAFEEK